MAQMRHFGEDCIVCGAKGEEPCKALGPGSAAGKPMKTYHVQRPAHAGKGVAKKERRRPTIKEADKLRSEVNNGRAEWRALINLGKQLGTLQAAAERLTEQTQRTEREIMERLEKVMEDL